MIIQVRQCVQRRPRTPAPGDRVLSSSKEEIAYGADLIFGQQWWRVADTREFDELGLGNTPNNFVRDLARQDIRHCASQEQQGTLDRLPNWPQVDTLRRRRLKGICDMGIVGEAIIAVGLAARAVHGQFAHLRVA